MSKKQVVFIMTDTTRYDMVGCYGNSDMKTPYLDNLAQNGVRFEYAYTCQPVCGPARSSIFTGQYPHSNGSFANSIPLGANVKTIGQRLSDFGIHTAYIGKWHLDGGDYFGTGKCPEGWDPDYWYDMRMYLYELSDEERYASRNPALNETSVSEDFTYGHRCSNRAIDFLSKFNNEDFFLSVSYDEPHHPSICPEPYASMYKDYEFPKSPNIWDNLENKPNYQKLWGEYNLKYDKDELKIKSRYLLGCNSYVDYEIGRVIEAVNKHAPDALIIFTSDHGDALMSHSLYAKGNTVYDEIARVPFIISGKGMGKGVCPHPVSHINIVPTVLDYMGLHKSKVLEGESVIDSFKDPDAKTVDYVFTEFTRYEVDHDHFGGFQPMRACFDGRYKLAIHLMDEIDELYDLKQDPSEMNNLIFNEDYKDIRLRLHNAILENMNKTRDPFRGYVWEQRPWRYESARPSWHYTGYTRQREEDEKYEPRQLEYDTAHIIGESQRYLPNYQKIRYENLLKEKNLEIDI